jgi:hypothetical protein
VKVGDVCFVLIGQIVNRNLIAIRYQPSGGLVINSPIESPALVEWVKKDWGSLDERSHTASLLADIRDGETWSVGSAMTRLRFYYRDAYASLRGEDLKKREAFEAAERTSDGAN